MRAQGPCAGGDEIGGEGEPRSLTLERGGMRAAVRQNTGQIRFEECRDMRSQREAARNVAARRLQVRRGTEMP